MKAHLTKVSLALLSAAFLLGCQEQASSPVEPEGPEFHMAHDGTCEGHDKKNNAACVTSPRNAVVTVTVVSDLLKGIESGRAASLVNGGSSIHNVELIVTGPPDNVCSAFTADPGEIRGIIGILDAEGTATYTFPVPLGSPRWKFEFSGGEQSGDLWPPDVNGESTTWTYSSWQLVQISPKGKQSRVHCPINSTEANQMSTITVLKTR